MLPRVPALMTPMMRLKLMQRYAQDTQPALSA
jgi:hypothetical protein